MAAYTTMLDFHVDSSVIGDDEKVKILKQHIQAVLSEWGFHKEVVIESCPGFIMFLQGEKESHGVIRAYPNGFVTITLEEGIETQEPRLSPVASKCIQQNIQERLKLDKIKRYAAMKRGGPIDQYIATSDNRIVEYDFDKIVYEADSPYQNIKILHSPSFGNLLVLDDLQNLAESDLIYTQSLMKYGNESYEGKEVLILGGGDGALLHELLKENPKFVTMIEIDKMVMDACRIYLRSACGDCLDKLKGPNYEIIIDDCVKMMNRYIEENRTFDYVFGDLTDIPITPTPQGEFWDFMRHILELSMKILRPTGKYLTHGTGINAVQSQQMYEDQLQNLSVPITFAKHTAHVPSFMETWVFYEVKKVAIANGVAHDIGEYGQ
uniref:Spermine synthase n=1 Tax=Scolopendra viridis TaxID=118503 RepID=A0A4D5R934_SCOVI